ncbi:MAG: hypothetical protein NTV46_20580 [Verrucomicrobia bacterium]|nr:hypothetical protein [Verrucomicrobiota bacterium]
MRAQFIPSVILSASLLAGVIVTGVAAEGGRGKPDDWFVKSDKPKEMKPTQFVSSAETRDIIPPVPGAPVSQSERKKPPSPLAPRSQRSGAIH